jgi:predicted DsbA family dithiol-disulfide isomerase
MDHHRSGQIKMGSVTLPTPPAGTIAVWSDVGCPWATLALHRLYAARARLKLDDHVAVDHGLFLLEDVNEAPTRRATHDAEIPVVGSRAPELGLTLWHADVSAWPVTTALANEAVQAAKMQSLAAAEEIDMALRLAFFRDSRCISLLHEVIAVAETCSHVDVGALRIALDEGGARGAMMRAYRLHAEDVQGSPHFVLPDGDEVHNPGMSLHWEGKAGGFPVIDSDDPSVYDELVRRAAERS